MRTLGGLSLKASLPPPPEWIFRLNCCWMRDVAADAATLEPFKKGLVRSVKAVDDATDILEYSQLIESVGGTSGREISAYSAKSRPIARYMHVTISTVSQV